VPAAWHDLAAEHLADRRRIDAQLREVRKKITIAVRASGITRRGWTGPSSSERA
jgi:hypothetical protein